MGAAGEILAILAGQCATTEYLTDGQRYSGRPSWCSTEPLLAIPCFMEFALLCGWMIWIIVVVYRAPDLGPDEAFQVSVHRLLRGRTGREDTEVDLMEGRGMIDRFEARQGRVNTQEMSGIPLMGGPSVQRGPIGQDKSVMPPMGGMTESGGVRGQEIAMAKTGSYAALSTWREDAVPPPPYVSAGEV